jgi:polysaccharide export outer membrane protein
MHRTPTALCLTALLAAGACSSGPGPLPPAGPDASPPTARHIDPDVERWFRANVPASGTRLMAGDRISVSVQGRDELHVSRDVPPNGEIPVYIPKYEGVKSVMALGKTPQELETEIAKIYAETIFEKAPYVTVSLDVAAPRSIYVGGAVKAQGSYPVNGNDRLTLLQALLIAGGTTEQSDLHEVLVQRFYPPKNETVTSPPLDVEKVYRGDQRDNLIVEAGDTIIVPDQQDSHVQVVGQVERPGSVVWRKGMTLIQAISEAGSFKRFARKDKIQVVRRNGESLTVNFDEIMAGKVPDLVLEPRDVIYIDERWI